MGDFESVDFEQGDDMGLGEDGRKPTYTVFDLKLLQRLDAQFEEYELTVRKTPPDQVEASRDFCFVCTYGDQGESGTDESTRAWLTLVRDFVDFMQRNFVRFALVEACRRIKVHYELHIRNRFVESYKPAFAYSKIAEHILKHDKTLENVVALDMQTHAQLMGALRDQILETSGGYNSSALKDYIALSNNFHRHMASSKKRGGVSLSL